MSTEPNMHAHDQSWTIILFSSSNLFFWWPVWCAGFILAVLTHFGDKVMVVVPSGSTVQNVYLVGNEEQSPKVHQALVPPEDGHNIVPKPHLRTVDSSSLGLIFASIVFLVIYLTTVRPRGIWGVVFTLLLFASPMVAFFYGWWDAAPESIAIHISRDGYLLFAIVLFLLWGISLFFLNEGRYVTFQKGQIIFYDGEGEYHFESHAGWSIQVEEGGLRDRILGMGSGTVVILIPSYQKQIRLENVLFVRDKVDRILQRMNAPVPHSQ